jgi:hypothetical protein
MQLLFEALHALSDSNASATIRSVMAEPSVQEWMTFRQVALTGFFRRVSRGVKAALAASQPGRTVRMGVGTRSPAFAAMCGYDLTALAAGDPREAIDLLMPKTYLYHRGFDGLVGTVARYCRVLCDWNRGEPGAGAGADPSSLSYDGALSAVKALFGGLELPVCD